MFLALGKFLFEEFYLEISFINEDFILETIL